MTARAAFRAASLSRARALQASPTTSRPRRTPVLTEARAYHSSLPPRFAASRASPSATAMTDPAPALLKPGALSAPPLDGPPAITALIAALNVDYLALHKSFEDQFWATKMGLASADTALLASSKTALEAFLADKDRLAAVRAAAAAPSDTPPSDPALAELAAATPSPAQAATLKVLEKAFDVNQLPTPEAASLREELNSLEAALQQARNGMKLGYTHPATGAFTEASGVQLRNLMRTSPDEKLRKAAYEGLRSIGPAVLPAFCEIVKKRNALAVQVGGPGCNFYQMKLRASEGMGLDSLFGDLLSPLEAGTRPTRDAALAALAKAKGADAVQPWNRGYLMAGDSEAALNPFFPFSAVVPGGMCAPPTPVLCFVPCLSLSLLLSLSSSSLKPTRPPPSHPRSP
jgi:hypothetical protein